MKIKYGYYGNDNLIHTFYVLKLKAYLLLSQTLFTLVASLLCPGLMTYYIKDNKGYLLLPQSLFKWPVYSALDLHDRSGLRSEGYIRFWKTGTVWMYHPGTQRWGGQTVL